MGIVKCHIAMSLDGYVAGPNQSVENPLGEGATQLHEWAYELKSWREAHGEEGGVANPSSAVVDEVQQNVGAVIMGRNMFGGGRGGWGSDWRGWWGEDPPFHAPVFVLTHHEREPLEMRGGTTFHFVTDGLASAHERAREAAGDGDVSVAGGASAVNQSLKAGLLDELEIHVVPVLLGDGARLFEGLGDGLKLEVARAVDAPGVTHLKYRVAK